MSYDPKCYQLAIAFLADHTDPIPLTQASELAQIIQDAIESYFEGEPEHERK
jgi:hypothetical protein